MALLEVDLRNLGEAVEQDDGVAVRIECHHDQFVIGLGYHPGAH